MRIEDPQVLAALSELGVEIRARTSLSAETYLGIGGTTDLLSIKRHDSIPDLLKLLDSKQIV